MKKLIAASLILASATACAGKDPRVASAMEADIITTLLAKSYVDECPEYSLAEVLYSARDAMVLPVLDAGRKSAIVQFNGVGSDGKPAVIRTLIHLDPVEVVTTLSVEKTGAIKEDLSDANELILPSLCTVAANKSFR